MLILKVDILQTDKSRSLKDYPIENRRALTELIKVSIMILHFLDNPFSLTANEEETTQVFDQFFKKFSTVLACLNRLKDDSEPEYSSQYFVSKYLSYEYNEEPRSVNLIGELDVIEFVRPTQNNQLDAPQNYKKEIERRNK